MGVAQQYNYQPEELSMKYASTKTLVVIALLASVMPWGAGCDYDRDDYRDYGGYRSRDTDRYRYGGYDRDDWRYRRDRDGDRDREWRRDRDRDWRRDRDTDWERDRDRG
jgi:hypothetical protein